MVQTNAEKDPNEMGDTTDTQSPKKQQKGEKQQRTGKGLNCEVVLLDGEHVHFEVDRNADGKDLFEKVCQHLDLIEKDYFGIQYVDERLPNRLKCWLSPDKKINKQKKGGPLLFDFALKFYPPDPTQLRESLTRWLVVLQTRRDILSGKLPTTFLTQAMLGSYCVQADVGDFDPSEHRGIEYIRDTSFAPNQTADLLEKIVELHKQHKGQTPDEAEINFLENAKKLSMYGVDLHEAQDANNVDITLGVCASGLQVYREKLRISRFVWPKILKICYKRRHFYVKIRPSEDLPTDNTVSFKLASHRLAKRLWKICVEHHAFFRLREAEQSQNAAMFPRLGSKFRYSGRTLYQTRQNSQILDRPDPYFERSQPARNTFAAPANRSHSVDEISNRPDHWKDDEDYKKRPDGKDEKDRKDLKDDDPYATATRPGREDMRPLGSEDGGALEPGANKSMDGKDRLDRKPGDDDATLEREGAEGMMGLTAAELQKKAKEDEKERKKREKEEEKRRKKEEEERKKAEKAAKKGKGKGGEPSAEDRKDVTAGGDNTEKALGRTPGSYGDQEGKRMKGLWCFGQDGPRGGRRSSDQDGHDQYSASEQSDSAEEGQGKSIHGSEKEGNKHRLTRGKKQGEQDNSVDKKRGDKKRGYTGKTGDGYKDRRGLGRGPRSSAGPGREGDREHRAPGSTEHRDRQILEADQNGELHPGNNGRKNKPHVTRESQSRRILAGGLLGTGPASEGPMKGDDESSDRDSKGEKSFEKSSESETSDSSTSDSEEDQQLKESKENRYAGKRGKDAKGKADKHKAKGKDAKKRGKDEKKKGKDTDRHGKVDQSKKGKSKDRDVRDEDDTDEDESHKKDNNKHGKSNRDVTGKGKDADRREDEGLDTSSEGTDRDVDSSDDDYSDGYEQGSDKDAYKHGKLKGKKEKDKKADKHGKEKGRKDKNKDAERHGKDKGKVADKHGKVKDKDADKHGKVKDQDADKHGNVKDKDVDKHGKVKDKDADKHGKDKDKDAYKHGKVKDKDADKHEKVKDEDADKHGKDKNKDAYKHGTDRDADKYRKDRDADRHGKDKDADKHGKDKGTDKHGKDKDKDAYKHGKDKDADRYGKDRDADKYGKDKGADKHGKDKDKDADRHGKDKDKDADRHGKDKKADKYGKDKDRTDKDKDAGKHWKDADKDAGKHGKDKGKDTDDNESDASTDGKDSDKNAGKHRKDKSKDADKRGKDKNTDKHRKDKGRNAEKLLKDSDEDADKHLKDSDEDADKRGKGKDTDKHRKDREKDADKHGKGKDTDKHRKDREKDADKHGKGKVTDKHRKDRGKDADKYEKDEGKDSDKHRKDKGKDIDKHGKDKGKDADKYGKGEDKDTDKHGKSTKKGGFFSMFKKPRDSRQSEDEVHASPGRAAREQEHRTVPGRYPDDADGGSTLQGSMYPSFGPGLLTDGGDMSGVVGEETWIDNKLKFEPIVPPQKETKDSLKSVHGIDHTMPYFSPDATSTVGRPGKGGPPIPPKINSFDDSYDRTDVYKNNKDGIQETRVQHKMVLSSADDEDFDYDAALADAIRSVTEFNPDMSVERIECVQQIEDARDK